MTAQDDGRWVTANHARCTQDAEYVKDITKILVFSFFYLCAVASLRDTFCLTPALLKPPRSPKQMLTDKLYQLAESFPVVVISGARQVGKSTLLQNTLGKETEIVVFDPVIDIENARQDPELFLNNHTPPLILDEIQYAPELIASIKRRIDRDRSSGQYIPTGSQQWGVMKSMSESLAGRAVFLDLYSFSLLEIGRHHSTTPWINKWLRSPEAFLAASPTQRTAVTKRASLGLG